MRLGRIETMVPDLLADLVIALESAKGPRAVLARRTMQLLIPHPDKDDRTDLRCFLSDTARELLREQRKG
jgi:hypothetical protein